MKAAVRLLKKRAAGLLSVCAALFLFVLLFDDGGAVEVMRADAVSAVRLPIIMYHAVLKDPQRANNYTVSPAQLEKDLLYLKNQGYTAVLPRDLVDYVNGRTELPDQPVMITFDDGYYSSLVYVLPILERMDMKAVVSVVGSYTQKASELMDQNPAYAYLAWEDIRALEESGRVEIASHTYALHSINNGRQGVKRKNWESREAHESVLKADIEVFKTAMEENCGFSASTFTYPYGSWDDDTEAVLRETGFAVTLTCRERMNYIERNPASLYHLGRYNRPSGVSTEEFMQKALKG
ncbi:MAG TPA: polysaccharide deacetylase family protein [Feifaniaceae bacterium]|nr:polysaccharide deacetylase family protein [Feifaniaceae bacterium]